LKSKVKYKKYQIITIICLVFAAPLLWLLLTRFEGEKPSVVITLPCSSINASQELSVSVSDDKSGIQKIWLSLYKDGKDFVLLDREFKTSEDIEGKKNYKKTFSVKITPRESGISDGKAILRIVVRDFSWRGWGHGNKTYIEKNVNVDTVLPDIDVLSRTHNISPGGSALAIYRLSEPCAKSGVYVGENFFPGHSGHFKNPDIFMAFFALRHDQGPKTEIFVKATDKAGNNTIAGIPYYIKKKVFKADVLKISDKFLKYKMQEFNVDVPGDSKTPLLDKFLIINNKLRKINYETIIQACRDTDNVLYWNGRFKRLPRSANRAGFADRRTYKYNGKTIDHQTHLGVDLASVAHSPVPASNRGKVVFMDYLGIYGKTIILDHGFGLFSMYSHLSSYNLNVKKDKVVSVGEIIGNTGVTGLAGGDHLHFGMLVHQTFVNPVEWWDASWIDNNIMSKIRMVQED